MTKKEAINLFGGKSMDLAKALGKGKSAISQWGDILDKDKTYMVIGAALCHGVNNEELTKYKPF